MIMFFHRINTYIFLCIKNTTPLSLAQLINHSLRIYFFL